MTTHTDPWHTLPTNWRTPTTPTPHPPATYYRPLPNLKLPDTTCHPHCRRCHHPEGRGHCHTCLIICDHTKKPRTTPICITRTRAPARTSTGTTGRTLLVVDTCPHCGNTHTHSTEPTTPYRRAACGHPYLLETR